MAKTKMKDTNPGWSPGLWGNSNRGGLLARIEGGRRVDLRGGIELFWAQDAGPKGSPASQLSGEAFTAPRLRLFPVRLFRLLSCFSQVSRPVNGFGPAR